MGKKKSTEQFKIEYLSETHPVIKIGERGEITNSKRENYQTKTEKVNQTDEHKKNSLPLGKVNGQAEWRLSKEYHGLVIM